MKACSYRKEKTITLSVFVLLSSLLFTGIAAADYNHPLAFEQVAIAC